MATPGGGAAPESSTPPGDRTIPRWVLRAALLLFTALSCELLSWGGGRYLASRGLFYRACPPGPLGAYLARRDPVLGWVAAADETDGTGSRLVPAFPDPSVETCVSIYGDSFAWSEEVGPEDAWGNVLAQSAGCRVANYGVPSYGSDQAYLRYARNETDRAPVVILTHLSENILRNVNRLRSLLSPTRLCSFKPRFVIGAAGDLVLVPLVTPRSDQELEERLARPESLENEYFAPGGPARVTPLTFPYTASIVRVLSNYRVRAALAGETAHAAFYGPDHPSGGLAVTAAIARAFQREATARGAAPVVIVIPLAADFASRKKTGRWDYAPLLEELDCAGIPRLDAGERFLAALGGSEPCTLYTRCSGGHFNKEANRMLGEFVHAFLRDQRTASPRRRAGQPGCAGSVDPGRSGDGVVAAPGGQTVKTVGVRRSADPER